MKTQITCLVIFLLFLNQIPIKAQGFKVPEQGKSFVYFVSLKKKSETFEFFLNDKYIGILGKKNYMIVECKAGKNLLWASSESKYFVPSDLASGESYIIIVESTTGFWRVNPKLTPITSEHPDFKVAVSLIKGQPPMGTPQTKIEKMNHDMIKFISEELAYYETKLKNVKQFPFITSDMSVPRDEMK